MVVAGWFIIMAHTEVAVCGGEKSPLERDNGRVGPGPVPTALPIPGKVITAHVAAGAVKADVAADEAGADDATVAAANSF